MGMDVTAKLVYGVCVKSIPAYDWNDRDAPEVGPAHMAAHDDTEGNVSIVKFGYDGCMTYVVAIESSCSRYHWDARPAKVDVPKPRASWAKEVIAFVEKYGLEPDGEPSWLLGTQVW